MSKPDLEIIAEVLLFTKGFRTAEITAAKIVPFFTLCQQQLSSQPHYDFGLRALKSVLVAAGVLMRQRNLSIGAAESPSPSEIEQQILVQSVHETIVPKLVSADVPLLQG